MNNIPDLVDHRSADGENTQTRREMFRGLARWLILGVMGSAWAILSVRSARNSHAATCSQSLPCSQCPLLGQCDVPKAAKTREADTEH
jgi:hypothetical protein